jgi:hypothetical protein
VHGVGDADAVGGAAEPHVLVSDGTHPIRIGRA